MFFSFVLLCCIKLVQKICDPFNQLVTKLGFHLVFCTSHTSGCLIDFICSSDCFLVSFISIYWQIWFCWIHSKVFYMQNCNTIIYLTLLMILCYFLYVYSNQKSSYVNQLNTSHIFIIFQVRLSAACLQCCQFQEQEDKDAKALHCQAL